MMSSANAPSRVLFVTGLSGAGKSTALDALEDIGYEAIDNLPLRFVDIVTRDDCDDQRHRKDPRPLAVGLDARTSGFDAEELNALVEQLRASGEIEVSTLFLDCDDEEIARRFTTTRRKHPMSDDRPVMDGIQRERALLGPVRRFADAVIDTTQLTVHDLKRLITERYPFTLTDDLVVTLTSFSFRRGLPRQADLVFDVRFLRNPHYDPVLKEKTGLDAAVAAHVLEDPNFPIFYDRLTGLMDVLLPNYSHEGKRYLTIAIGCTGGKHRSVFMTERLAKWFEAQGHGPVVHHRELGILR